MDRKKSLRQIFWVEGDDPSPLALFRRKADAERELARRQALDVEDEDVLTMHHQVFRADVMGVWWNSYDPDPRADSTLSRAEILEYSMGVAEGIETARTYLERGVFRTDCPPVDATTPRKVG
jgi:hypothetical protein